MEILKSKSLFFGLLKFKDFDRKRFKYVGILGNIFLYYFHIYLYYNYLGPSMINLIES